MSSITPVPMLVTDGRYSGATRETMVNPTQLQAWHCRGVNGATCLVFIGAWFIECDMPLEEVTRRWRAAMEGNVNAALGIQTVEGGSGTE